MAHSKPSSGAHHASGSTAAAGKHVWKDLCMAARGSLASGSVQKKNAHSKPDSGASGHSSRGTASSWRSGARAPGCHPEKSSSCASGARP